MLLYHWTLGYRAKAALRDGFRGTEYDFKGDDRGKGWFCEHPTAHTGMSNDTCLVIDVTDEVLDPSWIRACGVRTDATDWVIPPEIVNRCLVRG